MRLDLSAFEKRALGINGPEGVAVDQDGWIYGGGADGLIRKWKPGGNVVEVARVSDGQLGGLAFDREDNLFVCDGFNGRVMKVARTGAVSVFAEKAGQTTLYVPNFPAFDAEGNLWVSNSWDRPIAALDWAAEHASPRPAADLVRLTPNGQGAVIVDRMFMSNGLAIDRDNAWIYVLQTTTRDVVRLRLDAPLGTRPEPFGPPLGGGPDGMAFDAAGDLIITMPAERRLVRLSPRGALEPLAEDPAGELMPFPTNCAFGGDESDALYIASMHADHFACVRWERPGLPLYNRRR